MTDLRTWPMHSCTFFFSLARNSFVAGMNGCIDPYGFHEYQTCTACWVRVIILPLDYEQLSCTVMYRIVNIGSSDPDNWISLVTINTSDYLNHNYFLINIIFTCYVLCLFKQIRQLIWLYKKTPKHAKCRILSSILKLNCKIGEFLIKILSTAFSYHEGM